MDKNSIQETKKSWQANPDDTISHVKDSGCSVKLKWVASNLSRAKANVILLVGLVVLLVNGCVPTGSETGQKCFLYADVEEYSNWVWAGIWSKWDKIGFYTSDYLEVYDPMDHIRLIKDEADAGPYPPPDQQYWEPLVNLGFPFEADGFEFDLRGGPYRHDVNYMIVYAFEYTIPPQPCDSTINWEAPLQVAFPQGVHADDTHWIQMEWLVNVSPTSDYHMPDFALELIRESQEHEHIWRTPSRGHDWGVLDYSTNEPFYKTEILRESSILPANTSMNLFLGVSIRVYSRGGDPGTLGQVRLGPIGSPTGATFQIKNGVEYEILPFVSTPTNPFSIP